MRAAGEELGTMAGDQQQEPTPPDAPDVNVAPEASDATKPTRVRRTAGQSSSRSSNRGRSAPFANWRLEACLISPRWRLLSGPAQLVVTRVSGDGAVASGVFVVDLGCLGVKDAGVLRHTSLPAWHEQLGEPLRRGQGFEPLDLNQAARIVRDGVAFARMLGFEAHPSLSEALPLLAGADPDAALPVPLGRQGTPFFVSGPRDDARAIIAQLERAVGAGHFRVVLLGSTLGPREDSNRNRAQHH
jgi:hypothetical protein